MRSKAFLADGHLQSDTPFVTLCTTITSVSFREWFPHFHTKFHVAPVDRSHCNSRYEHWNTLRLNNNNTAIPTIRKRLVTLEVTGMQYSKYTLLRRSKYSFIFWAYLKIIHTIFFLVIWWFVLFLKTLYMLPRISVKYEEQFLLSCGVL